MAALIQPGQAGTVESNDILIVIAPSDPGTGITIELNSPVIKQYGERIREVIAEMLDQCKITDAFVHANDKGALDCTIRARVQTAIARASAKGGKVNG